MVSALTCASRIWFGVSEFRTEIARQDNAIAVGAYRNLRNCRINVETRDYDYLSQCEIGGAKRISQHLSGSASQIHWGKIQMRPGGKSWGALGNTFDAKKGGRSAVCGM